MYIHFTTEVLIYNIYYEESLGFILTGHTIHTDFPSAFLRSLSAFVYLHDGANNLLIIILEASSQ